VININWAEYRPGCGRSLVIKRNQAAVALSTCITFVFTCVPLTITVIFFWGHFHLMWFIWFLIDLLCFYMFITLLRSCFDPMAAAWTIDERGFTLHDICGKSETLAWQEIEDIKIGYAGRHNQITLLCIKNSINGNTCRIPADDHGIKIKELVGFLEQWRHYYTNTKVSKPH
jgi:hypothetical protein